MALCARLPLGRAPWTARWLGTLSAVQDITTRKISQVKIIIFSIFFFQHQKNGFIWPKFSLIKKIDKFKFRRNRIFYGDFRRSLENNDAGVSGTRRGGCFLERREVRWLTRARQIAPEKI